MHRHTPPLHPYASRLAKVILVPLLTWLLAHILCMAIAAGLCHLACIIRTSFMLALSF
jgi:hypothetical protein